MKRTLSFAALMTLGAAALAPLPAMAQNVSLVISSAPPAPRFETVPAARNGYVWAPGFWNWDGRRHVWLSGHWESQREGHAYLPSSWIRDEGGYRLQAGGWMPLAQPGYAAIQVAPPPPRYERMPQERRGYLWEPGHWEWRGNRHEWTSGVWIAERPGYQYAPPRWQQRNGGWYFEPSRWTDRNHDGVPDRYQQRGRDRDHDGIPDRYERRGHDRDQDGVPDRRDADRDGDGVRNSRDREPDNPRRN
ncbi:MAG: YXWGXW repeat-containing protein [Pseudomonadota bacterium]